MVNNMDIDPVNAHAVRHYDYVNLTNSFRGEALLQRAEVDFNNNQDLHIYQVDSLLSLERFHLKSARLPVFLQPSADWRVRTGGGSGTGTAVNFSNIVDSRGQGFNYADLVEAINDALATESGTADNTVTLDSEGHLTLSSAVLVEFNPLMTHQLNIFYYQNLHLSTQTWYAPSDGKSFEPISTLFPLNKLIFRSREIPIKGENIQNGNDSKSDTVRTITDFQLSRGSMSAINDVEFTLSGVRRFHTINGDISNNFKVEVYYQLVNEAIHPLYIVKDGLMDLKFLIYTGSVAST